MRLPSAAPDIWGSTIDLLGHSAENAPFHQSSINDLTPDIKVKAGKYKYVIVWVTIFKCRY